jgi:fructose-bisphosphate aldolase class I
MFDLMHAMRARIIKSPAFTGDKVVGAILFDRRWTATDRRGSDRAPTFGKARRGAFPEDRQGAWRRKPTAFS